jgi:NAD(P)-dependent dehydrogenase (short-subunit alcohol dehydrogenase family)
MRAAGNRVALVTGGSRGLGRAMAIALGDAGFEVVVAATSRRDLDETRERLEERGVVAFGVTLDVRDRAAVGEVVRQIESRAGAVGVLVNNAGSLRAVGPLWQVDPDDWLADVETSLVGAFNCCREVLPAMIERGEGRIVNVVSYAAARSSPYTTGYAPAKAALANLTEGLAGSLAGTGVTAFAVAPGLTDTAMTRHLVESEAGRKWLPEMGERAFVDPALTARLVASLAGGAADDLSGRVLHTLDVPADLLAHLDEIRRRDLYALRLHRL